MGAPSWSIPKSLLSAGVADAEQHDYLDGLALQLGYIFPELKPRHRNVAVMGQINFADNKKINFYLDTEAKRRVQRSSSCRIFST